MELGNEWVFIRLSRGPIRGVDRNRVGLTIHVKARRDVEEFMSALSQGRRDRVDDYGEGWINCNPDGGVLEAYNIAPTHGSRLYTIDNVAGSPFIQNQMGREDRPIRRAEPVAVANMGLDNELINLSFFRLVGVSGEAGVSIGILGAYSMDYLRRLRDNMRPAVEAFLKDYIVPVTINLHTISKS